MNVNRFLNWEKKILLDSFFYRTELSEEAQHRKGWELQM